MDPERLEVQPCASTWKPADIFYQAAVRSAWRAARFGRTLCRVRRFGFLLLATGLLGACTSNGDAPNNATSGGSGTSGAGNVSDTGAHALRGQRRLAAAAP